MTKQFMQGHDDKQRWIVILQMHFFLTFLNILHSFFGWFAVSIAQIDILKAVVLSDFIIVRDINANWNATWCEGQNF